MTITEDYTNDLLKISVTERDYHFQVNWQGKSIDRKPSVFITPILIKVLKKSMDRGKRMILDFREIEYMNSSTITPIIKILERAKRGKAGVTVKYLDSLKWQQLIF